MSLVDFTPEQYCPGRNENRLNMIYIFLFTVIIAAIVVTAWFGRDSFKRMEKLSQVVDEQYRKAGEKVVAIETQRADLSELVARANIAAKLIQPMPRYEVLSEISSAMPDGVTFSSIKLKTLKPASTANVAAAAAKTQFKARAAAAKAAAKNTTEEEIPLVLQADVLIDGVAGDNEQIAGFLCNLKAIEVFRNVDLVYTQYDEDIENPGFRFQMRLMLDTSEIKKLNVQKLNDALAAKPVNKVETMAQLRYASTMAGIISGNPAMALGLSMHFGLRDMADNISTRRNYPLATAYGRLGRQ